ncbi:hypothetical protein MIND_00565900 [Mycena indigotica]|uniref:Transmembrane protein n=1 Tax=Mycena indigotica TaxID=2126181 RepID=A0A8H6W6G0_9AGAR|nr:uncharacterized protein MIND_00565900 [Mycena indigotica]KAF7303378.1 hypothetical protein MIND_00565900 [Mycena indigotica]
MAAPVKTTPKAPVKPTTTPKTPVLPTKPVVPPVLVVLHTAHEQHAPDPVPVAVPNPVPVGIALQHCPAPAEHAQGRRLAPRVRLPVAVGHPPAPSGAASVSTIAAAIVASIVGLALAGLLVAFVLRRFNRRRGSRVRESMAAHFDAHRRSAVVHERALPPDFGSAGSVRSVPSVGGPPANYGAASAAVPRYASPAPYAYAAAPPVTAPVAVAPYTLDTHAGSHGSYIGAPPPPAQEYYGYGGAGVPSPGQTPTYAPQMQHAQYVPVTRAYTPQQALAPAGQQAYPPAQTQAYPPAQTQHPHRQYGGYGENDDAYGGM